jgi:hypothetical protein
MSESTLTMGFTDLRTEVADFLGLGRDSTNWAAGTDDGNRLQQVINSGLRRFLYPVSPEGGVHEWSFLRLTGTISAVVNDWDYTLGDDVGTIEGDIVHAGNSGYVELRRGTEADILRWRAETTATGIPRVYATRWRAGTGTTGQRLEVLLYPVPNGPYTLSYRYKLLPSALNASTQIYALGSMAHTETILAACKAAAEETMDDTMGLWASRYAERLAASISLDREQQRGEYLGYNGDGHMISDEDVQNRRFSTGSSVIEYS